MDDADLSDRTTEAAWIEARTLDTETTRATWALAARHVLADTAMEYHAVITVPDLATAVQRRTKIRTKQAAGLWMGDVLYRVAQDCHRRREPLLGALCVGIDGHMSDWYADTVLAVRGERVNDPEQHAAQERLECYRTHGAELPPGGGVPALPPRRAVQPRPARAARATTPRATAPRPSTSRTPASTRAGKPEPREKLCPSCYMALPATGVCDTCD